MNWLDFTITLTTRLAGVSLILAVIFSITFVVLAACSIFSSGEYLQSDFISMTRTTAVLSAFLWILGCLPTLQDVAKTNELIKEHDAIITVKSTIKSSKKKEVTKNEKEN